MKNMIFVLALMAMGTNILSQTAVTGWVGETGKDSARAPLAGVNIYWLGTTTGTQSGPDGRFTIKSDETSNKLVFSFIGYETDTVEVRTSTVDVRLKPGARLQEVTVASSSSAAYSKMSTVTVQHIGTGELRKAACCNLSESFTTNASVDVNYSDAVSGAKQLELLGLAGKYSQIMVEKMPQVRGLSANYGLGYIPGSWMESIQVSKGTSSVVDGFESTTGQINVEFKKPFKGERMHLNVYASDAQKMEINTNARFKVRPGVTSSVLVHGENFSNTHDDNHDGFIDMPAVQQLHLMNRWSVELPSGFEGQFGVKALEERRYGGTQGFDGRSSSISDSTYGIIINTSRQEAFSKTGFIFPKPGTSLGFINNISRIDQQSTYGRRQYDAVQNTWYSNLIFESIIGNTDHKYNVGASMIYDFYDERYVSARTAKEEYTPGIFAQYTYTHLEQFTLMGGIRADYSSLYGMFFTPRAHAKYHIDEHTTVRLSGGKGYRSPNALMENMNLLASARTLAIADDIEMEDAWNYGVTLSRGFRLAQKKLTAHLEYFRTDFVNQVVADLDTDPRYAYIGNQRGSSFSNNYQIELSFEPVKRLELLAAYRYSDARAMYNGSLQQRPLSNSYKGLATVSYATNMKKWQIDLTAQLNGGGRLPYTLSGSSTYPAYTLVNAQLTKNFRVWSIYAGIENLLDFTQKHPITDANDPYSDTFDAATTWGPVEGRMLYAGLRLTVDEFFE